MEDLPSESEVDWMRNMTKKSYHRKLVEKTLRPSALFDTGLREGLIYGDPLTKLILKKWGMPFWLPSLILFLFSALLLFGLGGMLGYIGSRAGTYGTMDDPGQLIISFVFQPFMLAYHFWLSLHIWNIFETLIIENVIKENSIENYRNQIQRISSIYNGQLVIWISISLSILMNCWITTMVFNLEWGNFWVHQLRWIYIIFELPKALLIAYVTIFTAARLLILYFGFHSIFKKVEIRVQPLHSDNAGGLASIGTLVLSYVYWIIVLATFPAAGSITNYVRNANLENYLIVEFIMLPVLAFLFFFLPIQNIHGAMRQCAKRELAEISALYENLSRQIKTDNGGLTENNLNLLTKMIDTSERTRKMYPLWPFNISILRRFFIALSTSLAPLLLSVSEIYLSKLIP